MRICSRFAPLAALAFMALSPHGALAGAAPEEAFLLLQEHGYSDIEITPGDAPGYRASACKGGTRFAIHLDARANIVDVDPVGHCGAPPRTNHAGGEDIHVKAPFADVRVGGDGVRIRAPFVDLDIR